MAEEGKNLSLIQAINEAIRGIAWSIWILGGLSYITGYLVVNFYLSQYGVATLNLVQSRYFASGALYLIVSLLVIGGPLAGILTAEQLQKTETEINRKRRGAALIASSILLAGVVCWACGIILVSADRFTPFSASIRERQNIIWLGLPASQIALAFPFIVYSLTREVIRRGFPAQTGPGSLWSPAVFGGLFIICFLISTVIFARYVYANSSPSVGGGAPITVQLIVSKDLVDTAGFPLEIEEGVTERVALIDHSGSGLVVLRPQDKQVVEILEDQVLSIIH
jgi:hypothetical protein